MPGNDAAAQEATVAMDWFVASMPCKRTRGKWEEEGEEEASSQMREKTSNEEEPFIDEKQLKDVNGKYSVIFFFAQSVVLCGCGLRAR